MRTLSLMMRLGWALVMIYAPMICLTFCQVVDAVHHRPVTTRDWRHEWAMRHLPMRRQMSDASVDTRHTPFLDHLSETMRAFTEVNVSPLTVIGALSFVRQLTHLEPSLPTASPPDVPHPPPRTPLSTARA